MKKSRRASERMRVARVSIAAKLSHRELLFALALFAIAFFSVASLLLVAAVKADAKPYRSLSSPPSFLEPCKNGLDLYVRYQAAQAVGVARPQTLKLRFERGGAGAGENVEKGLKAAIAPDGCQAWQAHAWPHVDRMIAQSKSKARKGFECANVAEIRYELGGKRKKSGRICIGNAREDGLSNAFYQFFDQTQLLVAPKRARDAG